MYWKECKKKNRYSPPRTLFWIDKYHVDFKTISVNRKCHVYIIIIIIAYTWQYSGYRFSRINVIGSSQTNVTRGVYTKLIISLVLPVSKKKEKKRYVSLINLNLRTAILSVLVNYFRKTMGGFFFFFDHISNISYIVKKIIINPFITHLEYKYKLENIR